MAAAKPKKPGDGSRARYGKGIPRDDDFLPGVDTDVRPKMHKELSGRKHVGKDLHIISAAIKWRGWLGVSEMARQMIPPRSTIRDRLVRLRDRLRASGTGPPPATSRYWTRCTGSSSACGRPIPRGRTDLSLACGRRPWYARWYRT